jgi:hypothetical protein
MGSPLRRRKRSISFCAGIFNMAAIAQRSNFALTEAGFRYFSGVPEKAWISHWPLRFIQTSPTAM